MEECPGGKSVRGRELESTTQSIPIESQSGGNMTGDREGIQRAFLYVRRKTADWAKGNWQNCFVEGLC